MLVNFQFYENNLHYLPYNVETLSTKTQFDCYIDIIGIIFFAHEIGRRACDTVLIILTGKFVRYNECKPIRFK